jgi:Rha family phage regulatory protein
MNNDIALVQTHGIATADSREVAEHFEKQHGHIMRELDQLKKDLSNFGEMFFESSYRDSYCRSQRCYRMTRDGFSLLVMGFTGRDALHWKIAYIRAFNELERRIITPPTTAEHLLQQAQLMVDTERRLTHVETGVQQVAETVERISAGVAPLGDGWQVEAERRIQTTCQQYGLDYRETHTSLYGLLESRAHCDLTRRVMNKRLRMAYVGATKAAQDSVSRLSVIADDADLRAHFERILQDWMLRIVCSGNPQQSA